VSWVEGAEEAQVEVDAHARTHADSQELEYFKVNYVGSHEHLRGVFQSKVWVYKGKSSLKSVCLPEVADKVFSSYAPDQDIQDDSEVSNTHVSNEHVRMSPQLLIENDGECHEQG